MQLLETERLFLYRLSESDAPGVLQLVNSPGWLAYIGDRGIKTLEDARTYLLEGPIRSYRENGFGLYGLKVKETGQFIGMCGLIKREVLEDVDIGFALLPGFEGWGYAFEAAAAVLQHAKRDCGLDRIVAIVTPHNRRSIRLLEKLGLVREGTALFQGEELLLYVFENKI